MPSYCSKEARRPPCESLLLSSKGCSFRLVACLFVLSFSGLRASSSSSTRSYTLVFEPEYQADGRIALTDIDADGSIREFNPGKLLLRDNGASFNDERASNRSTVNSDGHDAPVSNFNIAMNLCDVLDPFLSPEGDVDSKHQASSALHQWLQVTKQLFFFLSIRITYKLAEFDLLFTRHHRKC